MRNPLRERAGNRAAVTAGIFEGIRWIWRDPFLRALVVWMSLETLVFGGIGLVIIVLARDAGASVRELGVLFAITGAGSVAGALATPRLLRAIAPWTLVVGFSWIFTVATALLLAVHSPYLIGLIGSAVFFLVPSLGSL